MSAMIMTHEPKWPYALIPIFLSLGFVLQYFLMRPRE
jgi:hypothetical protein